ncbi:MAG: DUF5050 domain-containing protein, partial [Clostridiales bacterium]|nr:DUF5050 domain-containing protein [Clostridiales bacterium]
IYNYMISGYSIYTMDTDGSNSKKIMDLPVNTEGRDKTTFMVDDEYVYYIQPETGDFWKIDFEGNKNEYITSDTQLSNNDDLFGVYEYNGKVYYVLPSVDDSGKFTGYNLYRADLDNQNRILLAEGLTGFRMIDNLLIYNQNVYDENNNFITGSVDVDGIYGCDKDYIYFCYYDDNMTKHIYKYNINTCKIADITDDLYYEMLL